MGITTTLNKLFSDVRIINIEIDGSSLTMIPDMWLKLFAIQNFADKKNYLLTTIWRNVVNSELRNTIGYLEQHLTLIELLKIGDSYSILYSITNEKGKVVYYKGDTPASTGMSKALQTDFLKLPQAVRAFYTQLHNGFYYLASESMGLVPLSSVTRLADEEWGIVEELPEPLPVEMEHTYGFFTNGMGGYVVIDTANSNKATLWWIRKKPKPDIDFWGVVDEWIMIGMQA